MNLRSGASLIFASVFILCAGCMPAIDAQTLKEMRPPRPREMEHLVALIGRWETSAETKIPCLKLVLPVKGVTENSLEADGWYMVERGKYEMGEIGDVHEFGVWTWDPATKRFRTWRYDSFGGTRMGTARYDEDSKTWTVRSKRRSAWGSSRDRGTIRVVDDQTLEWSWQEWSSWDVLRLFKMAEFNGTSKRK